MNEHSTYRDENGKLHRKQGPSRIGKGGHKEWYIHGKRHREDGPAIEWKDGTKWWFFQDNFIMKTVGDFTKSQIQEFYNLSNSKFSI